MQDEAIEKPKVWLNRRKASLWLEARYGMRCSPATLAKKAVRGNGPAFAYMGSLCVYTPEDLELLGPIATVGEGPLDRGAQ